MFEWLQSAPILHLALVIFCLRIIDVSFGTIRTISVVEGRIRLSVIMGFFEVLIWITAVSQVIVRIHESPILLVAYAGGFATGNAVGILLERRIAMGTCVVRLISREQGQQVADHLRISGLAVTSFQGEGRDGPNTLVYVIVPRKEVKRVIRVAREVDPDLYYVIERISESGSLRVKLGARPGLHGVVRPRSDA